MICDFLSYIPDTAQVLLMNFLWLRGGKKVIICVNMNIFALGGGLVAIICANIEVNIETTAYLLE